MTQIHHITDVSASVGVADRVKFEIADAQNFPGENYDPVDFFDCLYDSSDPVGAARRASTALGEGGSALIVKTTAGNTVRENFNPIGRTFAAAATLGCTSNPLALDGPALGAAASEEAIRDKVQEDSDIFGARPRRLSIASSKRGTECASLTWKVTSRGLATDIT